jgi:uncharacterized protein YggT (Ycf19 family)
MMTVLYISVNILILALFLYSKLTPYKMQLTGRYKSAFTFFERLFEPVLNMLRKIVKPTKVGTGIAVDISQVVLLTVLLIILKFI